MACQVTDESPVFTYASGLELNSPRFSQPGDFFTYVAFVATIILVGPASSFLRHPSRPLLSPLLLLHLPFLPAQRLVAESVPGLEEDYPCGTYGSIIRNINLGSICGVGMVVATMRKLS